MDKSAILKCLSETLEKDSSFMHTVDLDTSLSDIGLTSLGMITFIVKLEEEFNIEIRDSDLVFENFSTINNIYTTLAKYLGNGEKLNKVLILDADGVLWKGISGEESVIIDEDVLRFQKTLLELYERGVLLCLCSRNEEEFIGASFTHPRMLLKCEHFAIFVANQNDKSSNISKIAEELNLSPDGFVFADDSDYELGFVQLNFPEITSVKVDYSGCEFIEAIASMFKGVQNTSDLNRTKLYHEQKQREKEKHRFTSVQEYNLSLETQIRCDIARSEEIARLAELSERTHQFNLSNTTYTSDELGRMISNHEYTVISLSVIDKYGDMGIVGLATIKGNTIEAFMLSCRVFGRDLEFYLLNKVKELAGSSLCGIYRPNGKNERFSRFYEENGVKRI